VWYNVWINFKKMRFLSHQSAVGKTNFLFRNASGPEGLSGEAQEAAISRLANDPSQLAAFEDFIKERGYADDRTRSLVVGEILNSGATGSLHPEYRKLVASFEAKKDFLVKMTQ